MGFYDSLRELGYTRRRRVLDAFQYGVPQHRARLILVAPARRRRVRVAGAVERDHDPARRDRRSAAGAAGAAGRAHPVLRPANRLPAADARRGVARTTRESIYDHITRDVRPDDAEAFALLEEGQTYVDLPEHLRRYRSDIFTDKYKRLSWNEVSRSITAHIAKDGYWYIHPQQHRTLSIREAARVQTFPDWFRFAGQPTLRLRQIGNAVPPLLGEAVGRQLRAALWTPDAATRSASVRLPRRGCSSGIARNRRSYPWRSGRARPLDRARRGAVPRADARRPRARRSSTASGGSRRRPRVLLSHADPVGALEALGLGARAETARRGRHGRSRTRYGGSVPEDELELRSLPGVGDNVAQAVLCFGFGRRAVLLDATTARLVERFCGRTDTRRWQIRLDLYQLAGSPGPGRRVQPRAARSRRARLPRREPALRRVPGPRALRRPRWLRAALRSSTLGRGVSRCRVGRP